MKPAGREALLLPDWDEAYYDTQKITRMMRRLAEGLIQGADGKDENADLFGWLAERLESCHERLDQAVRLVPQQQSKGA